jgi:adenine-specific DNA-methyltransferase
MTASQPQFDLELGNASGADQDLVRDLRGGLVGLGEAKGVVYTKQWVVDLTLDLAGYRPEEDLAARYAVEPSAGEGAFFIPMVQRLLASLRKHGRPLADARPALHAYELDKESAAEAIALVVKELSGWGAKPAEACAIAKDWVSVGDYLLVSRSDRKADVVVGNPPYIRYDDLPEHAFLTYRRLYPTMVGRCDIYVGFIEAGLRQLVQGGTLAFICADRWMRAAYGAELRRLASGMFGIEVVIEMHDAPAFENDVAAYPAIIVIRRAPQGEVIVANAGKTAGSLPGGESLADAIIDLADKRLGQLEGFKATRVDRWFNGTTPWPSLEPHRLALLQDLESRFHPLEDASTGTKIGIGVATGSDAVYVTKDASIVESDRLLPLAMSADTRTGTLKWSGHYLVDPWKVDGGVVDLKTYPRLGEYFESHRSGLVQRNIAKRSAKNWYRTIDRVNHELTGRHKLYFPDMKIVSNPTLDRGGTYPHHNLYYLISDVWDLEVLGGLLLSRVAQLFIEAYCVKMRGGTLRFQAQYLRRIRVPDPLTLSGDVRNRLRAAFQARDADAATHASLDAYGVVDRTGAVTC